MFVRWPGKIPANEWSAELMSSEDWLPTLMAAAGDAGRGRAIELECSPHGPRLGSQSGAAGADAAYRAVQEFAATGGGDDTPVHANCHQALTKTCAH